MFLRKLGNRVFVLHSYRDGRGKVCQRRLGHFRDAAGFQKLMLELPQRFPDADLAQLRGQAEQLIQGEAPPTPQERAERVRKAAQTLLTLLNEEDAEVLAQVDLSQLQARLTGPGDIQQRLAKADQQMAEGDLEEAEAGLRELVRDTRSQLSPRRRRFEPEEARPYFLALDRLGQVLERQARLGESAQVMEERVGRCPTPQARLFHGSLLQQLDRPQEALQQYARVSNKEAYRHYNLASACWQQGRHEESLLHLLRGVIRDPLVADALKRMEKGQQVLGGLAYWMQFGQLWNESGRKFFQAICTQPLVQQRLRITRERGVVSRDLVSARSRGWLLQRGLAAAASNSPRTGPLKSALTTLTRPTWSDD